MSNRVNCNACPCRNNDYELGEDCNLEYDIEHDHFSDGVFYSYSDNCGLFCVETDGGPIYPKKLELEIAPRKATTIKEDKLSAMLKQFYGPGLAELFKKGVTP